MKNVVRVLGVLAIFAGSWAFLSGSEFLGIGVLAAGCVAIILTL